MHPKFSWKTFESFPGDSLVMDGLLLRGREARCWEGRIGRDMILGAG